MAILDDYVNLIPHGPVGNVWSCFAAGLRDARKASGRDQGTGAPVIGEPQGNWLGAIGYLCLFDQLGRVVALANPKVALTARIGAVNGARAEKAFRSTLYRFSGVDDPDAATLWALRNSLAHNYSLVNVPLNPNRIELRHRFVLHSGGNSLVVYPAQPWDGNSPPGGGQTVVSLSKLCDLGEEVVANVLQAHQAGDLITALSDGELMIRYFLQVGQPQLAP